MEKRGGGVNLSRSGKKGVRDGCGGRTRVVTLAGQEAERVGPLDSRDGKAAEGKRGNHERSGQPSQEWAASSRIQHPKRRIYSGRLHRKETLRVRIKFARRKPLKVGA